MPPTNSTFAHFQTVYEGEFWCLCKVTFGPGYLSGFLPCVVRAEILTIFCSYFGRNDDFIDSFWNWLTFSYKSKRHKSKDSSSVVGWNQALIACTFHYLESIFEKKHLYHVAPVAGRLIKMRWALLKSKADSGSIINKNKMALVHTCLYLC
jgi:hypothetical protein